MSISYALVLLALGLFGCAIWALFWAIDDGQYDDLEQHASVALEEKMGTPLFPSKRGAGALFLAKRGLPRSLTWRSPSAPRPASSPARRGRRNTAGAR